MTSLMALAWALEPSAFTEPAEQARPDTELLPELEPAGAAEPAGAGSEPQAARVRVPRASTAASLNTREVTRFGAAEAWSMVMRVLHETEGHRPLRWVRDHTARSTAGRALPMRERYASELSGRPAADERMVNDRQGSAQAWGRCRSTACASPSRVTCATRNSPVTSAVGASSS